MAKRVRITVPTQMVVRDCDMQMLDVIDRLQASDRSGARIAGRDLAEKLEISPATMHRNVNSCVERGFLEVRARRQGNGAQLANSYYLTEVGRAVLNAAREAGVV